MIAGSQPFGVRQINNSIKITFLLQRKNANLIKILTFFYLLLLTRGFVFCIFFSNPTFLIIWLIILRFMLGLIFLNSLRNWIIYVIVLLFTGGIIVLFTYITSLVISSKINFPSIPKIAAFSILPLTISLGQQDLSELRFKNLSGLYNDYFRLILLFIALYLVLILIRIVKIATSLSGPIKSFFTHVK